MMTKFWFLGELYLSVIINMCLYILCFVYKRIQIYIFSCFFFFSFVAVSENPSNDEQSLYVRDLVESCQRTYQNTLSVTFTPPCFCFAAVTCLKTVQRSAWKDNCSDGVFQRLKVIFISAYDCTVLQKCLAVDCVLKEKMFRKSQNLKYILSLVPGKRRFGTYRFLPLFFCIGGVMEWIMINVRIGKETFCKYAAMLVKSHVYMHASLFEAFMCITLRPLCAELSFIQRE